MTTALPPIATVRMTRRMIARPSHDNNIRYGFSVNLDIRANSRVPTLRAGHGRFRGWAPKRVMISPITSPPVSASFVMRAGYGGRYSNADFIEGPTGPDFPRSSS
jgi:hypothetical protein